jgi:hypothetical protein
MDPISGKLPLEEATDLSQDRLRLQNEWITNELMIISYSRSSW